MVYEKISFGTMKMKIFQYRVAIAIFLFAIALYLPSLTIDIHASEASRKMYNSQYHEVYVWPGWKTLLLGWTSVFAGVVSWLANPLFFYGMTKKKYAGISSIIAMFVVCTSWGVIGIKFPADEAGVNEFTVSHFNLGFYVWWLAILVMGFGSIWAFFNENIVDKITGTLEKIEKISE